MFKSMFKFTTRQRAILKLLVEDEIEYIQPFKNHDKYIKELKDLSNYLENPEADQGNEN